MKGFLGFFMLRNIFHRRHFTLEEVTVHRCCRNSCFERMMLSKHKANDGTAKHTTMTVVNSLVQLVMVAQPCISCCFLKSCSKRSVSRISMGVENVH